MTTSKVRAYSNRDLFSPSSGGQKSEIKMWADLAPSGGPEGDPSCLFQLLVLLAFLDLKVSRQSSDVTLHQGGAGLWATASQGKSPVPP